MIELDSLTTSLSWFALGRSTFPGDSPKNALRPIFDPPVFDPRGAKIYSP